MCYSELRELLTVQTHVMEGEDSRPAGGPCAVEGHVQDAMWGVDAVLLERENSRGFYSFICLPKQNIDFK